jgi:hypothetical protein
MVTSNTVTDNTEADNSHSQPRRAKFHENLDFDSTPPPWILVEGSSKRDSGQKCLGIETKNHFLKVLCQTRRPETVCLDQKNSHSTEIITIQTTYVTKSKDTQKEEILANMPTKKLQLDQTPILKSRFQLVKGFRAGVVIAAKAAA